LFVHPNFFSRFLGESLKGSQKGLKEINPPPLLKLSVHGYLKTLIGTKKAISLVYKTKIKGKFLLIYD
jgi:hypothetical protein